MPFDETRLCNSLKIRPLQFVETRLYNSVVNSILRRRHAINDKK